MKLCLLKNLSLQQIVSKIRNNMHSKLQKIGYSTYALLFIVKTLFYVIFGVLMAQDGYDYLDVLSKIVDCLAVIGFTYKIRFFKNYFWRVWFFISILMELQFGSIIEMIQTSDLNAVSILFMVIGLGFIALFYYILYQYAYKEWDIWMGDR